MAVKMFSIRYINHLWQLDPKLKMAQVIMNWSVDFAIFTIMQPFTLGIYHFEKYSKMESYLLYLPTFMYYFIKSIIISTTYWIFYGGTVLFPPHLPSRS